MESVHDKQSEEVDEAKKIARGVIEEGKRIEREDVLRNREMAKWGAEWLVEEVKRKGGSGEKLNVMTVCNTGSLATSVSICRGAMVDTSCAECDGE